MAGEKRCRELRKACPQKLGESQVIRRDPIYISSDVYRWLRLLAKAKLPTAEYETNFGAELRKVTADEIADQILRQSIREQHPTLQEGLREIEKMEKKIIENLKHEKPPCSEEKTLSGSSDTTVDP